MTNLLERLLLTVISGALPVLILLQAGPPKHESGWYPNPARWDYFFKMVLYAILDSNTPSQPAARWFVRVIALIILVSFLGCIWLR